MAVEKLNTFHAPPAWWSDFFFKVRKVNDNLTLDCLRWAERWNLRPLLEGYQPVESLTHPGTKPPQHFLEAMVELIEAKARQAGDPATLPLLSILLDTLRTLGANPEVPFDTWLGRARLYA